MSTPDKCPHCGAELLAEWEGKGYYVCGSFNNSGCHDTFPQSDLCKERADHAATKRELEEMRDSRDEANERLASLNEWVDCHAGELNTAKSELAATKRKLSNAIDTLDLMRDEFQRIVARMVEDGMIIKDVCTRRINT